MLSSLARLLSLCGGNVFPVLSCVPACLLPAAQLLEWEPKSGSVPTTRDLTEVLPWWLWSSPVFLAEDPHPHLGLWMGADLYLFTLHLDLKDGQCPEGSPGPGESGQSSSHQTFHYELGIAGAKQCHDRLIPDLFKKKKSVAQKWGRQKEHIQEQSWISRRRGWKNGNRGRRDVGLGCFIVSELSKPNKRSVEIRSS